MYCLPTCFLVLFFLFSFFHHFSCASNKRELGWCEALFQCENTTAGFPFSGGNRPQVCGHPLLELHCVKDNTSIIISNHLYQVRNIDQTSQTLRLASAELLGPFCQATFTDTTLPSDIFELSPTYKSLTVFYLCNRKLPYRSSYTCPGRGPVSVSQTLDYHNSCHGSFTINVPKSFVPEERELNLTHLESALREGFEVKLKIDQKACQECSSSHGTCGFENNTQVCCKNASSSGCTKLHRPDADELHKLCSTPFDCGYQRDLFYPFWIPGREDCGHPNFKLECNQSVAEVSISSVKFRILEVNYISRIIRLARSDYMGGYCPQNPVSAPFNETILLFAPDTELLTIFYDCRDFSPTTFTYVGELDCDDEKSYYLTRNFSSPLLQGITGLLDGFRGHCTRNVSIPASGPALSTLQNFPTQDNLKKALEKGFKLGLNQECSTCIYSGGACGYSQSSGGFACYCNDGFHNHICSSRNMGISAKAKIGSGAGVIMFLFLVLALFHENLRKRKTSHDLSQQNLKALIPQQNLKALNPEQDLKALIPLKQYSYAQVKRITKSFAEVVGKGGFGTVYRGTLCDGRSVAVKILKEPKGNNGEDFINEVASVSQTSHVNIVTLLGFCSEGSNRAILYEFLENGSLDKFISSKMSSNMDWTTLYRIALGVARGLEYLHHGCRTRIVHFDIKPQNVLLDDNYCPKVSDFGLAKLCKREESILSLLDTRGTIGYIAPEVFSRVYGRVSHKSDVYSYGMLVLEMVGARTKPSTEDTASSTSSVYFPEWIYKNLEKGDNVRLIENGINSEEEKIAKKMTLVGLWCIQSWPTNRPPMNRVVEMMEGNLNALELPPMPVFQIPAAPLQESSTLSEDMSGYTEIAFYTAPKTSEE